MEQKLSYDELDHVLGIFFGKYSDRDDEILLINDLTRFGIRNEERLCALIGKHRDRLRAEGNELFELIGKATAGHMPSCNGCSYTRAGLVRLAMHFEFGPAWCRYIGSLPIVRRR